MKRAILIVTLFCFISSSVFIFPQQRAQAFTWVGAVPAGLTVGGGVYALGALAVGSLAVGLGLEYGDEIKKHASNVWQGSTQLAKDSLNASLNAMSATGEKAMELGSDLKNWVVSKAGAIASIATAAYGKLTASSLSESEQTYSDLDINGNPVEVSASTKYPEAVFAKSYYWNEFDMSLPTDSNNLFYMQTSKGLISANKISVKYNYSRDGITVNFINHNLDYSDPTYSTTSKNVNVLQELGVLRGLPLASSPTIILFSQLPEELNTLAEIENVVVNLHTLEDTMNFLTNVLSLDNIFVGDKSIYTNYVDAKSRLSSLDYLAENGITLDLDNVFPRAKDSDVPLTVLPDGTYADADGVPYTGDVVFEVPVVTTIDVDGVPTPVSVDKVGNITNVSTGEIIGTVEGGLSPPSDGGILQGLWDWLKGILQAILNAIKALAGLLGILALIEAIKGLITNIVSYLSTLVSSFTDGLVGDVKNINWEKLKSTATVFSTKFPFSLPWDISRAFDAIFGDMDNSNGQWELTLGASTDKPTKITIKIPEFFDGWRNFGHTILLIIFDIGLIYAIRKLLGGAS